MWKEVQAAPTDFNAWTNLISAAEKLVRAAVMASSACMRRAVGVPSHRNPCTCMRACTQDELDQLVSVYDNFLASWPLCYGYWKKYADAEQRHGSSERAIAVYERGVAATPYSIDIWVHYNNFLKSLPDTSPDSIRRYCCLHGMGQTRAGEHWLRHASMQAPT